MRSVVFSSHMQNFMKAHTKYSNHYMKELEKRKRSAMHETVMWLIVQMGSSLLGTNVKQNLDCTNPAKAFAKFDDCLVLARSGSKICFSSFEALLPSLLSRISKYIFFGGTEDIFCRSTKLLIPSSCYISGISWPKLSNGMDGDAFVASCGRIRFLQRAVLAN